MWRSYKPKKCDFEKQGYQVGERRKIEEKLDLHLYSHCVVKIEDVALVDNVTLCINATRHDVAVWRGTMHKELLPPSGNEEYYTTAPQRETLHSRTLCWFAYFVASRICQRSVFLSSTECKISVEVECHHSYNNCYVLITRMIPLLSP